MSKTHYEILGVLKTSTQEEIKKAYRKLALVHHPDKGGDENMFKKICESYEILSDPLKRKNYDIGSVFGHTGLNMNMHNVNNMNMNTDFFYNLFSHNSPGFGHRPDSRGFNPKSSEPAPSRVNPRQSTKTTPNITHKCVMTLEDFYTGKKCKFSISRKVECPECSGAGGWGKTGVNCIGCLGRGCRETQKGTMNVKTTCIQCRGKGTKVVFERVCGSCKMLGVVPERVVAEACFEPGASSGDRVILKGMSDSLKGKSPGDVVVIASEKSHRIFKRKGNILKCSIDINIKQSLCGFSAEISQLDGRVLNVSRDEVTPHGHKIVIKNEGIPINSGHMEVTVNVVFPTKVPTSLSSKLMKCLDELVE